MGKTIAWPSICSSRSTSSWRVQRYSSGSLEPMCVWTSSSRASGTSWRMRSSQGSSPASSTTRCSLRLGGEQEVVRLALLGSDQADRADHRDEQALGMHVARVDVGRVDLAREQELHLLAVLGQVGAVHDRRPAGGLEVLLGVPDEVGEGLVQLAEVAVQLNRGHGLLDVIEAGAQVACRASVALAAEEGAAGVGG